MMKKRLTWIDITKGLGILFVVSGHVSYVECYSTFIESFHMPLFFVISGYLYHTSGRAGDYVKRKAKTLLIPYAVFGIATYLIWLLMYYQKEEDILSPLVHLLWINSTGLKITGAFWFLSALFFASVIFDCINRMIANQWVACVVIIWICLFGCLFRRLTGQQLPWSALSGFVGLGFMRIGQKLREYQTIDKLQQMIRKRWPLFLVVFICVVALIYYNGEVNMRRSIYQNIPLFWVNATVMCIFVMLAGKLLDSVIERSWFPALLSEIGETSIIYVCLDSMVIKTVFRVILFIFGEPSSNLISNLEFAATFAFSMIILFQIGRLFYRTKLKVLLGKW